MNQGWVRKKLKDCFKLKSGENLTAKQMIAGDYPVFGGNSQAGTHDQYNLSGDNVIVGRVGALCGNARHIIDEIWLTDNAFKIVNKKFQFENDFLTYLLNYKNLRSLARQAAQPVISNSSLGELVLEFPEDRAEQRRIVAILDQAFADIEQACAKTEQNLKNARELFESYLQQMFSQQGEGWSKSKLKDVTTKIGSGATPRGGKEAYKEEGISLIRSMNVHDRYFKDKDLALIDDEQAEKLSNVTVEEGDVLLNITGASVARCCVAPSDYLPARVNQHVSIIRVDQAYFTSGFLNLALTSKYYKDQLLGIGEAGSTRQAITKAQIEDFEINYPEDIVVQERLLNELLVLESKCLKAQAIYVKKLRNLDELKKSILQKAFSGELTKDSKGVAA